MVSRVRVLSATHVRPSETSSPLPADNENDDHDIKLSLFDVMMTPHQPTERLFFYEGDDLPPFSDLLGTLQSSLSATLAIFTPLAGHLAVSKSGDIVIDCSRGAISQGVRFVEAEYAGSTDDMRRLARDAEHDVEAYVQLAPALEVSPLPVPTLAVQVTRPADTDGGRIGAVVVGVSMSHVVGDGHAMWDFIRAWAAAARGYSPALSRFLSPVFNRAVINGHPKAEALARTFLRICAPALPTVNAFPKSDTTTQQRRRTYLLSASQIQALKQRISLQSNDNLADGDTAAVAKPPTTYIAVASLVWTSFVRAKNAQSRADDDAYLRFPGECRARLRPPMPGTFFGNCVKPCYARATVGELRDGVGTLARAASAVKEAIQEQLEDPLADADRWVELRQVLPRDRVVHLGSSNRFAAYETDFGWGKPSRMEVVSVYGRDLVGMHGAPEGAVQVSAALGRGCMEDFDANFLSQLHAQGIQRTPLMSIPARPRR